MGIRVLIKSKQTKTISVDAIKAETITVDGIFS